MPLDQTAPHIFEPLSENDPRVHQGEALPTGLLSPSGEKLYQLPRDLAGGDLAVADPYRLFAGGRGAFQPYVNPDTLIRQKGLRHFELIRTDEQVKIALAFKKMAVLSTGWEIASPEGKPEDWEVTEFVRRQFDSMDGTVDSVLMEILTALDFGYSVTEKVFGRDRSRVELKALRTKHPANFQFVTDAFGNLPPDGLLQIVGPDGKTNQRLPFAKFVLMTHRREFQNHYGESDLVAAYRAWWLKDASHKWMAMLLERFGIPPVLALYRRNTLSPTQIADLKTVLTTFQAGTSGLLPRADKDSLELWSPQLAGQLRLVFIPVLNKLDEEIARAILMPGNLGASPETAQGSFARARVIFDVFMFAIDWLRAELSGPIVNEQIVKPLVDLNFTVGEDEYPEFRFLPLTDERRTDLFEIWAKLLQLGAVHAQSDDEEHIRATLEFPALDEAKRPEPEPEPEPEEEEDDDEDDEQEDDDEPPPDAEDDEGNGEGEDAEDDEEGEGQRGRRRQRENVLILAGVDVAEFQTAGIQFVVGRLKGEDTTTVQTILFDKARWEAGQARAWLRDHEFRSDKLDETEDRLRFRQRDPGDFEAGSLRTISAGRRNMEDDAHAHQAVDREPNARERRADFQAMERGLDSAEGRLKTALVQEMRKERERLRKFIRKEGIEGAAPGKMRVRATPKMRSAAREGLRAVFDEGRKGARDEIKTVRQMRDLPGVDPEAAIAWLEAQADFFVTSFAEDATKAVRQALLVSLRAGHSTQTAMKELADALLPFAGDPRQVGDPLQLSVPRVETIVRTNSTTAFNQGRLVEMRQAEEFVQGVQHSAIIDTRTTEICRHLDGRIYRPDDPDLDRLTPPLHFNCRSVLVPVLIDEEEPEFISPADVGRAKELAQPGFGGDLDEPRRRGE